MLVVDNNKMKLLRMKEKLLEVSPDNYQNNLVDFRKLAIEIDNEVYNLLVNHIKETNYHDLPFEEQLDVLNNIVKEYDDLNELECSFKKIYQKYSNEQLDLSDLSNILIDAINDRISHIQGYLLNNSYLEKSKIELENLSLELISEEKRHNDALKLFDEKEEQLKTSFLNAEGRKKSINNDDSYISFISEFEDNSLDLRKLLIDDQFLDKELEKAIADKNSATNELEAVRVCYRYVPSIENREAVDSITLKVAKFDYKFTLLQMANLIITKFNDYKMVKSKREKLKALNTIRLDNLKKMGIDLLIDPFKQLKIDEQLNVIENYGDNLERISVIRRNIVNVNTLVESRNRNNINFMVLLNASTNFIKDKTSFGEVKDEAIDVINEKEDIGKNIKYNQVISINDTNQEFMIERAKEKTDSVIKRVYQLYMKKEDSNEIMLSPDLIVLPSKTEDEIIDDKQEELFPEIDKNEVEIQNETKEDVLDNAVDDLFQDVKPFEDTVLFNNKYDDVFDTDNKGHDAEVKIEFSNNSEDVFNNAFEEKKNDSVFVQNTADEMPQDLFWVTDDKELDEEQKVKKRAA